MRAENSGENSGEFDSHDPVIVTVGGQSEHREDPGDNLASDLTPAWP